MSDFLEIFRGVLKLGTTLTFLNVKKKGISLWGWLKIFPVVMYECESWTIKKTESEELMLLNCSVGEDP